MPLRRSPKADEIITAHRRMEPAMRTESTVRTHNPQSTAQIAGHPLHPMLIPFPVAFLVATLVCDVLFWNTGNAAWSTASLYLLGAALIMAGGAALDLKSGV